MNYYYIPRNPISLPRLGFVVGFLSSHLTSIPQLIGGKTKELVKKLSVLADEDEDGEVRLCFAISIYGNDLLFLPPTPNAVDGMPVVGFVFYSLYLATELVL